MYDAIRDGQCGLLHFQEVSTTFINHSRKRGKFAFTAQSNPGPLGKAAALYHVHCTPIPLIVYGQKKINCKAVRKKRDSNHHYSP